MFKREDIIRMAREARLVPEWLELCPKDEKALERFVALVAAAKDAEHPGYPGSALSVVPKRANIGPPRLPGRHRAASFP